MLCDGNLHYFVVVKFVSQIYAFLSRNNLSKNLRTFKFKILVILTHQGDIK